ncbi:LysR family transcriptional regulator [Montanilutibacter psychrotolerans]|uniref:LysR family transcriptional regulator n=1 Tax=Montanilutibacter psychrotolerans TaxID=1327343 RepID=A0A3M8SXE1_9GAMM|nr:LysR family transcriptional regulator [Lysobacter psychrotolerans]RNF85473.1 LysR family transcriptional regulator [Lysobacter psychrotolerans]
MTHAEIDSALLLALKVVLEERNVTRAATRLGITQPALSGRLARLREIFGDALFVPAANGRGVVPTPRAQALEHELLQVLAGLKRLVDPPAQFDPVTSTRTFVVALFDTPAAVLAPDLSARVQAAAPLAKLAFIHPPADVLDRLEQGQIDLLVTGPEGLPGDLMQRPLWADGFRTAQRKGHPRGVGPLDLDTFCTLDHLIVSSQGGRFAGVVDDQLLALGRSRNVRFSIQSYALAPLILASTDCVCTLPTRFLSQFADQLEFSDPPVELSDIRLALVWHPRSHQDASHVWLRQQFYLSAQLDVALP